MKTRFALTALIVFSSIHVARAQAGCDVCAPCANSPELPTALLAVVGAVGVGLARRFNGRCREKLI